MTNRTEIGYVGANLTTETLDRPIIYPEDLPCLLFGLDEGDIPRTHCHSLFKELEDLVEIDIRLSLGALNHTAEGLDLCREKFPGGLIQEAREDLILLRERSYQRLMDVIWPMYQQAERSPRNSSLPLIAMKSIASANNEFSKGDLVKGRGQGISLERFRAME